MEPVKFKVGCRVFEIPPEKIPKQSYLYSLSQTAMKVEKESRVIVLSEEEEEESTFEAVFEYLLKGIFPAWEDLPTFSYLSLDPRSEYTLASALEEEMRAKMYLPDFKNHPMNTDPHYGLISLTEEIWDKIRIRRPKDSNLLFNKTPLEKRSWDQVQESLAEINNLFSVPGVFVAGGRIFSALFGTPVKDIDLFFHSLSGPQEAEARVLQFLELFRPDPQLQVRYEELESEQIRISHSMNESTQEDMLLSLYKELMDNQTPENRLEIFDILNRTAEVLGRTIDVSDEGILISCPTSRRLKEIDRERAEIERESVLKVTRTTNALTFKNHLGEYQLILRLYRTPSEILHGFDVDSCCLGWDGKTLWMTQRALYSICNGYNTVNFGRLSPSYEYRLAKYGARGMAVKVPRFTRERINREGMEAKFEASLTRIRYGMEYYPKYTFKGEYVGTDYNALRDPRKEQPLKGLDILIYLEFQAEKRHYHRRSLKSIEALADEVSDYSGRLFKRNSGDSIESTAHWMIVSRRDYANHASEYLPLLGEIDEETDYHLVDLFPDDPEAQAALFFETNNIFMAKHIDFVRFDSSYWGDMREDLTRLCHLPEIIYNAFAVVRPWLLPREIQWKTVNPGEQMTGTFHQTVLKDNAVWYEGFFYQ